MLPPPPIVGVYTSTPPVSRFTSVGRIAVFSATKSPGVIVVIVSPAIPAATFAAFRRNCDFCTVVNVIPVNVAPVINVFERFVVLVRVAFARFTFDKSTFARFAAERLHAGPTINPPRSWKLAGRVRASAAAASTGETICPETTPAKVALVKLAPEISAAVSVAFVRFALVKLALVSTVFERFILVSVRFERITVGPTMNPPRTV